MCSPSYYVKAFLCLLFCYSVGLSQNSEKEIELLVTEALKYERVPDSLASIGNKVLTLAKSSSSEGAYIEGYLILGHSNYVAGDFNTSIAYYDSLLDYKANWAKKKYQQFFRAQRNKAIATIRLGKQEEGLIQFEKLLQLTIANNDAQGTAGTYNNIGISKKNEGKFDEAIDLYAKSMNIYDSLQIETAMPPVLINIGIVHSLLGNNEKSLESFHEAIKIAKQNNIGRDEYRAYNNLAVTFLKTEAVDSAIFYIKKSIPRYVKNNVKRAEYLAYQNLGAAFTTKKQMDSAYYYLNRSIVGFKALNNPQGLAESLSRMADLFKKQNEYDSAIRYADSSIAVAKEINNFIVLKNNYTLLSSIYEATKEFEKANSYLKVAQEIESRNFKLASNKQLNEILTKYQVSKKDEAIEALNKEKTIYLSTTFLVTIISIILLLCFLILWVRNRKSNTELTLLREELASYKEVSTQDNTPSMLQLKSKAVLDIKDLFYIKSDGHYLEFYIKGSAKPEIDRNTLRDIIEKLASEGFAQIHKSYVVNLAEIRIINSTKLMLEDGTWLPLSRTYKPRLKETLLHSPTN